MIFAQWLSQFIPFQFLTFIYTILEQLISRYKIYHGVFERETCKFEDKVICVSSFSIFSLINLALVIGCYSITNYIGPPMSDS